MQPGQAAVLFDELQRTFQREKDVDVDVFMLCVFDSLHICK